MDIYQIVLVKYMYNNGFSLFFYVYDYDKAICRYVGDLLVESVQNIPGLYRFLLFADFLALFHQCKCRQLAFNVYVTLILLFNRRYVFRSENASAVLFTKR